MTGVLVDVFDGEGFIVNPVTIAGDIDLGGDFAWSGGCDFEGLFVVAGHEIGIGGDSGFDLGVLPGAAFSDGFAELPEVVDGSGPEGGLAVGGVDEVGIVFWDVFGNSGEDEEATVAAEVLDAEVVGGDGTDSGKSEGVVCGEFVEGAVGVEEVALGGNFAGDAASLIVECRVAFREAEAAAVVVDVDDRGLVEFENAFALGNGGIFAEPSVSIFIVDFNEAEVGVELVEAFVGGEVEVAFVLTTSADDSAGDVFVRSLGEAIEHRVDQGLNGALADIDTNIENAWDSATGTGVVLGIVDDGVLVGAKRIWKNRPANESATEGMMAAMKSAGIGGWSVSSAGG